MGFCGSTGLEHLIGVAVLIGIKGTGVDFGFVLVLGRRRRRSGKGEGDVVLVQRVYGRVNDPRMIEELAVTRKERCAEEESIGRLIRLGVAVCLVSKQQSTETKRETHKSPAKTRGQLRHSGRL